MQDDPRVEQRKLYFEAFKHMTTLNTAAALVVLTIHRDAPLSLLTLCAISGFSLSLVTSLYGMIHIPQKDFGEKGIEVLHSWLLILAGITFFAGAFLAFVSVFLLYGTRSTLFFWLGFVLLVYGLGLFASPHLKPVWQLLFQRHSR